MKKKSIRPRLFDIQKNIDIVEKAISGKTFDDFTSDVMLRYVVERGVEIISEACRRIPEEMRQTQPDIPWRSILGIGNVLRHEYENVSENVIWYVIQDGLPPLRKAILAIQAALKEDE